MPLTREFTGTNIKYQMAFKTLDAETGSPQIAYVDYLYNDVSQHKTAYTYDALGNITKYDGSSFLGYNQNVWGKDAVLGDCISGYMANDWRFIYGIYIPLS